MGRAGASEGRRYRQDRARLPRGLLLRSGSSHSQGQESTPLVVYMLLKALGLDVCLLQSEECTKYDLFIYKHKRTDGE